MFTLISTKLIIICIGLHSFYTLPEFDFLKKSTKKLLVILANIYKLQFYNIDKLRNTASTNLKNEEIESIVERSLFGEQTRDKVYFY